ncbi:hypothetical protein [Cellulomonas phragmiteti]|uniref:DUF5709 domain-containing protein n=1 Tax=Cellulomonas phragmiteti TaxID=478780 RepID=A0ABQ4DKM1_9CELL|nr:hypothetical protein [Cellulomonas phragmiteti]GIG39868.1 hypothetical protein Cph01nite_16300 [Cellulomonas phragmiteti]
MTESFDAEQVPELEYDESVPPRPEEEVADVARAVPDPAGHGGDALVTDGDDVLLADSHGVRDEGPTAREVG